MKHVLIDLERSKYPLSGLGQYCLQFASHWINEASKDTNFSTHFLLPPENIATFEHHVTCHKASAFTKLFTGFSKGIDLWHFTHQEPKHLPTFSKNLIQMMTIHDLNFLNEKNQFKAQERLSELQRKVDRCTSITTISQFTLSVLQNHLDLRDREVKVIHQGIDSIESVQPQKPHFAIEKEFLFALGTVLPKKNFHTLIGMLERINQPELNLVIAGPADKSYRQEILQLAEKHRVSKQVILPGGVNDAEKNWLFKNCKAFVFPSLFEGFGRPIVEALSFGKPVFSSNKTSLPEVGGEHCFYWNDFHPDSMAETYLQGIEEFHQEPERIENQKKWVTQFTWDKTISSYKQLYTGLLAELPG